MNPPRSMWVMAVVAAAVLVTAGGATLVALRPVETWSTTETATFIQQPSITWSSNSVDIILSPGESASRSLTFTSSADLRDIRLEPVPELAKFLTITPNTFSLIGANQAQTIQVNFAIPASAALGDYDGTIQVRQGSRTLPQTLKATIHAWVAAADSTGLFEVKHPPGWRTHTGHSAYDSQVRRDTKISVTTLTSPQGSELHILPEGEFDYGVDLSSAVVTDIVIGGRTATRFDLFNDQQQLQLSRIKFADLHNYRVELWPMVATDVPIFENILSTLMVH